MRSRLFQRAATLLAVAAVATLTACGRDESTRDGRAANQAGDSAVAAAAWQRARDMAITAEVKARLEADDELRALGIHVVTKDGRVMLRGTAPNTAMRTQATELARHVAGVSSVHNGLSVQLLPDCGLDGCVNGLASERAPAAGAATALASAPALRQWVLDTGDNENAPFIIIDKRQARLWLFSAAGEPLGHTPVLLGLARGDASVRGIGERAMEDIQRHERTTPAGRFIAEADRNADGEDIFWIDYDAAVSMHRVRATKRAERRLQRLATSTPADNRISYGCINVPAAFYDQRIQVAFSGKSGTVYVVPETLPSDALFKPRKRTPGVP